MCGRAGCRTWVRVRVRRYGCGRRRGFGRLRRPAARVQWLSVCTEEEREMHARVACAFLTTLAVMAAVSVPAAAQCDPNWQLAIGVPGVNSTVWCALAVDEASAIGPAVYAGGRSLLRPEASALSTSRAGTGARGRPSARAPGARAPFTPSRPRTVTSMRAVLSPVWAGSRAHAASRNGTAATGPLSAAA